MRLPPIMFTVTLVKFGILNCGALMFHDQSAKYEFASIKLLERRLRLTRVLCGN
jgi:hypothetical protein